MKIRYFNEFFLSSKQYGVRDSSTNMTFYQTKWDFVELSNKKEIRLDSTVNGVKYSTNLGSYNSNHKYYHDFFIASRPVVKARPL